LQQQFDLGYFAKGFNYTDTENMPVSERNYFHKLLSDTIDKKNEEMEKANRKR